MSGSSETREPADEEGTPAVPSTPAPPSFGGDRGRAGERSSSLEAAASQAARNTGSPGEEAEEAEATAHTPLRLTPFGLETPWWAASPEGKAAAAGDDDAPETPVTGHDSGAPLPGDEPAAEPPEPPPGTLVAGIGVPRVDSRGAVPAEPLVQRAGTAADTDPDGFPAVRPDDPTPRTEPAPQTRPSTQDEPTAGAEPVVDDEPTAGEQPGTSEDEPAPPAPAPTIEPKPLPGTPLAARLERDGAEPLAAEEKPPAARSRAERPPAPEPPVAPPASEPPASQPPGARPSTPGSNREVREPGAAPAPVLVPDAILPPGVTPPDDHDDDVPDPDPREMPDQALVITTVYHSEGGIPTDVPGVPSGGAQGGATFTAHAGATGDRRAVLIGTGVAALLVAAIAVFLVAGAPGDDGTARKAAERDRTPKAGAPAATAAPTSTPVDITSEKTDPRDLPFEEVFPGASIQLGGHTYERDRWSINRNFVYAANGAMLDALQRGGCRKIVRATFIDKSTTIAVTSGVAVMPTKAAALKVSRAGDPATYEWFRGMSGKHADIDRAGGYAAATVRGRYVIYSYVQYADGKEAKPGDAQLKGAAQQFLGYTVKPIDARARG